MIEFYFLNICYHSAAATSWFTNFNHRFLPTAELEKAGYISTTKMSCMLKLKTVGDMQTVLINKLIMTW